MQIVLHIGANCTDGDLLVRSLTKNARTLADEGIAIPGLAKYRRLLRETIQNLGGATPDAGTRYLLVDAILDEPNAKRLVMSNSAFICLPIRVFEAGEFYGLISMKLRALTQLFPNDDIELCLALRNPATFVPAAFETVKNRSFQGFMNGISPHSIRWSELITRIQAIAPRAKLTVWCNEDTPLIWSEILHRMTNAPAGTKLRGEFDVLATIMSAEGMARFASYLNSHPPQDENQMRRVISAFLDKYAIESEIEEEIDLPDWSERLVEELTVLYEADVDHIAQMPGVDFISP